MNWGGNSVAIAQDTDSWDPTQYADDARPSDEEAREFDAGAKKERIAVIRTSDRLMFRRCRRRWGWNSHLRGNIGPKQSASPLWMGTGFHFAMEDFHGENKYGNPMNAFRIFRDATIRAARNDMRRLPGDINELTVLACGMLEYYSTQWLRTRDPLKTFVYNGIPQLEVNFRVDIPMDVTAYGYDRAVYSGTLDRVIEDEHGQLWIVEYKTAKSVSTLHFENDTQVSAYCWAGNLLYGRPITGVIYQQHRKEVPHEPKVLANGRISQDKAQLTTHSKLRALMQNVYGSVEKAPMDYKVLLNYFATVEDADSDKFIRRDRIRRNAHQCEAEGNKILMEVSEMLNPDLPLYPNPDRTCAFMCPFNGTCTSVDDGSDWEYELDILMQKRDSEYDRWRRYLPNVIEHEDWLSSPIETGVRIDAN
jgi:hypothetical protein